jgi:hypothetical protein
MKSPLLQLFGTNILNYRKSLLSIFFVSGVVIAFLSVAEFGENLDASSPVKIPTIGVLHRLQLPKDVVNRNDIRSFEIQAPDADDFIRVYVNNYLVAINEHPDFVISDSAEPDSQLLKKYIINRKQPTSGPKKDPKDQRKSVDLYLRDGLNYIVVEVENTLGPCDGGYKFFVNSQELKDYPSSVPYPQKQPNETSDLLLLNEDNSNEIPAYQPVDIQYAICSRRIYEFELKT